MNGVLLIDKPQEFTSFDVVAVIRKLSGQKKIGHTGTLDPNATGVLVVLLGSATKAQDLILNHDKTYVADFKLGITTDTLDIWGKVISEKKSSASTRNSSRQVDVINSSLPDRLGEDYNNEQNFLITIEDMQGIIPEFTGEISQLPPMFSAVQKNGQRLYDLARQGIEVERESRNVTIYGLELLGFDKETQSGTLKVACSKGTYIRTLIDDIGRKLGVGAVMTGLRRTSACGFDILDCITLDRARELAESGTLEKRLLSVESLFESLGYVSVTDAQARRFSNGGALDIDRTYLKKFDVKDGEIFRVKDRENTFLGLGIVDLEKRLLKIHKLF